MNVERKNLWPLLAVLTLIAFTTLNCGPVEDGAAPTPTPTPTATPTPASVLPVETASPTPTLVPLGEPVSPTPSLTTSPCDGLSGTIEVRVLVGPAAAVGLEPFSVGSIPFSVSSGGPPYLVQGQGYIPYEEILTEDWGTYEVVLDLNITISGECGAEGLVLVLEMTGSQFVEVNSPDFHGEYPWDGQHTFNLTFPLVDGAAVEGDGWVFVLHL